MIPHDPLFAEKLTRLILQDGGVTIEWTTGHQPDFGYAVACSKESEQQILEAGFSSLDLTAYAGRYAGLLQLPGMYLGARVKEGVVYLDVSLVTASVVTAAALAIDSHQFAIRCLHESRSLAPRDAALGDEIEAEQSSKRYSTLKRSIQRALQANSTSGIKPSP